jgi:hypothetical protein
MTWIILPALAREFGWPFRRQFVDEIAIIGHWFAHCRWPRGALLLPIGIDTISGWRAP